MPISSLPCLFIDHAYREQTLSYRLQGNNSFNIAWLLSQSTYPLSIRTLEMRQ